jgi:hypothetical protein
MQLSGLVINLPPSSVRRVGTPDLNIDDVGKAAIVEYESSLIGGDEALQLRDAVTGWAAPDP